MISLETLLDYAIRGGNKLDAVVTGAASPLELLFPGGSYETSDFMYQDWAVARYVNGIMRAAVESITGATPDRQLRLLEVGAGTGGTTAQVLPVVPSERSIYLFTDVSDFFLARGRERFDGHENMGYGLLDIEQSPEEQGYNPGSFDVVIAANVLHATRDLDRTLEHVHELLAPGGMLFLLEATDHPHWFDVTIGLIEGWQAFDDSWRGDNPLLAPDRWREALLAAGFEDVVALPEHGTLADSLGQHVIIARMPGDAAAAPFVSAVDAYGMAMPTGSTTNGTGTAETNGYLDMLADALPGERTEVLITIVSEQVRRVLRAEPGRTFPRHEDLLGLGLDSLMAIELRDYLGRALALPEQLPATLIYDCPNIAAIASYLEGNVLWPDDHEEEALVASTIPAQPRSATTVGELSDEEIERLLVEKLERLDARGGDS